ncbi:MAG: HEAT repeat domain-containing protein [Planctomycetota bacterium]|nr:HEAT repeat domain-containing protein [Planctomycetota bacterium]
MRGLIVLIVLGLGFTAAPQVHAAALDGNVQATAADQTRELLSEGVKLYRVGRYDESALRLRDALLLEPENRLVYEFYLAMGDVLLMKMMERAELEPVMKDVLRKARVYQSSLRNDPRYIRLLIEKLRASEKERLAATTELVAIGPIAVPHLIERMADTRQDDYRVWSRMVLTRMGYRAVIPLTEALNSTDGRLVASVATILADIGDTRALPKLQQLVTDAETEETVAQVARNAIATIAATAGVVDISDPSLLYFQEAMRYFRDGDQVRDELIANESLIWRWDEDAQPRLVYTRVPRYSWNELIAEELLFDGMRHYRDFVAYHPLLAAVHAAQDVEARLRLRLAKERTDSAARPEETAEALQQRVDALAEMVDRVGMAGPSHLYRAVQQAIVSERYDVASYLMTVLRDRWTADADALLPQKEEGLMAGKAGTVLVAALDHPEKRVRYAAAVTLAYLDPKLEFFNAEKVVPLLSEAVGEWGMQAVLVVEPDYRHRNTAREQLMQQGMLVFTAGDGFEARSRLNETPVKDAIIIAGDLTPSLRDEHGEVIDVPEQTAAGMLEVLRADPRTENTPIFIALPEDAELANQVQTAFDGKVDGFVSKPFNGVEMKGRVEAAIGDAELPQVNREERESISLAACKALGVIDPVRTQYDLTEAAAALTATAENRADEIRIAAMTSLGHTGVASSIDRITEVYRSQAAVLATKPAVRAAFLYAIGLLDPTTESAKDILLAALQAEEREVRLAAAKAIEHGATITDADRYDYQVQQRLDVLGAGAGEE